MSVESDIYYAVKSAILAGMSAEEFQRLTAEAWQENLREEAERVARIFSKAPAHDRSAGCHGSR